MTAGSAFETMRYWVSPGGHRPLQSHRSSERGLMPRATSLVTPAIKKPAQKCGSRGIATGAEFISSTRSLVPVVPCPSSHRPSWLPARSIRRRIPSPHLFSRRPVCQRASRCRRAQRKRWREMRGRGGIWISWESGPHAAAKGRCGKFRVNFVPSDHLISARERRFSRCVTKSRCVASRPINHWATARKIGGSM